MLKELHEKINGIALIVMAGILIDLVFGILILAYLVK